jgi:hypothetical protein
MGDLVLGFLGGAFGAALVTSIFSLITYKIKRRDEKEDLSDVSNKALRYLMLYIIQERAKSHIKEGKITLEDRRSLHHWHSLYHNKEPDGLGGNGDADDLMATVDKLPLDINE